MSARWFLAALLCASSASTQAATTAPAENAATYYLRAFDILHDITDTEKTIVARWRLPLSDEENEVVKRYGPALTLLRQGAAIRHCEWPPPPHSPIPIDMNIPMYRHVTRLALLRARWELQHQQPKEGLEDLRAVMAFARHVARSPQSTIAVLLQFLFESEAMDLAAEALPSVPPELARAFRDRIADLPKPGTWKQAIISEKEFMSGYWRDLSKGANRTIETLEKAGLTPEEIDQILKPELMKTYGYSKEEVERMFREYGGATSRPWDKMKAQVEEAGPLYDEVVRMTSLSLRDYEEAETKFKQGLEKVNPIARMMVSELPRPRYAEAQYEEQRALFRAALDIVIDGPSAVNRHRDPFGTGSFRLIPLGRGAFRLESDVDIPSVGLVSLEVGRLPALTTRPSTRPFSRPATTSANKWVGSPYL